VKQFIEFILSSRLSLLWYSHLSNQLHSFTVAPNKSKVWPDSIPDIQIPVTKKKASFRPPPWNMPFFLDSLNFFELQWFLSAKRSLKVEKVSVNPLVIIIAYSNVIYPTTICKLTIGFRSTSETNLSSSPSKPTQILWCPLSINSEQRLIQAREHRCWIRWFKCLCYSFTT